LTLVIFQIGSFLPRLTWTTTCPFILAVAGMTSTCLCAQILRWESLKPFDQDGLEQRSSGFQPPEWLEIYVWASTSS
jgi:hypothetical protein